MTSTQNNTTMDRTGITGTGSNTKHLQEDKSVKILRNTVAVTVITVILLALFGVVFGGTPAAVSAAVADEKVSYLPIPAGTYNLDVNHSVIAFGVEHLEIAIVEGRFKDFSGTILYDDKDITRSSVQFSAKIASIDTGVAPRDAHLRTADFFDAEKFPEMTFKSTKVEKKGKGYLMTGDITIKGITRPISFPFTIKGAVKDPWGGTRFGIEAETEINRRDFGITYGNALPAGGFDVANEVDIDLHLEAVKAEPKSAE